jgi:plasmid stabilization system protein ParE
MPEIIWLPEALDDVLRLRIFLQEKSPNSAARAGQSLLEGANFLSRFPEWGSPMNDGTGRREFFIPFGSSGYVLRYRLENDKVIIIRAWHGRENREAS